MINKKNILIISTIFSTPKANKGTSVCNYFASEWNKLGHNVIAIYLHTNYPLPFYWLASLSIKFIESKTGAIVYTRPDFSTYSFLENGVHLYQIPIFKYFPHKKYTQKSINQAFSHIVQILQSRNFIPDIITGHFPNPQIEIVSKLKEMFPTSLTAVVMHGYNYQIRTLYKNRFQEYYRNIDVWGFRSNAIKEDFVKLYGTPNKSFICHSGIPAYYLDNIPDRSTKNCHKNFIFCGNLIKRKYPEKVLEALDIAFPNNDFTLTYVGSGGELRNLKKIATGRTNIKFLGQIPRKEIISELDKADCMIMISKSEAFGLVYLEAMARGCIVVASRNEGMDGIIHNGENGFLCEAGNATELSNIIKFINTLDQKQIANIVSQSILTASLMTDRKVAEDYLEHLSLNVND